MVFKEMVPAVVCLATLGCSGGRQAGLRSLCELQRKVGEGAQERVVVSGVYHQGLETRTLTDSACPNQQTAVEFDLRTEDNEKELQKSLGEVRQALVVFEGDFYGPPAQDPRLPEGLRRQFRGRWGHLGCCDSKLVVHEIREVGRPKKDEDAASQP